MSDEDESLRARREELLRRSAALREQLAARGSKARPAFRLADYVTDGVQWARRNPELPVLLASAALGALLVRPRLLLRTGAFALGAWQVAHRARPLLSVARRLL